MMECKPDIFTGPSPFPQCQSGRYDIPYKDLWRMKLYANKFGVWRTLVSRKIELLAWRRLEIKTFLKSNFCRGVRKNQDIYTVSIVSGGLLWSSSLNLICYGNESCFINSSCRCPFPRLLILCIIMFPIKENVLTDQALFIYIYINKKCEPIYFQKLSDITILFKKI